MFVCLDVETTGLNPKKDHLIEVAVVRFDHEKILDEWSSLIKAPVNVPEFVKRLTGINDEMLSDAPRLDTLKDLIREKVGDAPIMGHYIFFDVNFLAEHGIAFENEQLDTCQLAQTFLHNEASYSLEVLVEKLGIKHEDAHRALDDVKANIEFFWLLAGHIRALNEEEKESIRPLLEKSEWTWAKHLSPLLDENGGKSLQQSITEKAVQSESHSDLSAIAPKPPFLLEEPSHTYLDLLNYAKNLDDKAFLAIPSLELLPEDSELGILKHPNQYLDEERLEEFIARSPLNTPETMLAIKAKLWSQKTLTGDRAEIKTAKEELSLWFDICCQEHDEPKSFYKKSLHSALGKKVTAIDHYHFLTDRSRRDPILQLPAHTVIGEIERFVKTIESAWHIQITERRLLRDLTRLIRENPDHEEALDQISAKISILFGFIGMFIQNHAEQNQYTTQINVEPFHRNTLEWSKVAKSTESIAESLATLETLKDSATKTELQKLLHFVSSVVNARESILWFTINKNEESTLHSFPQNSSEIFTNRVWVADSQLHLFCQHGNLDDDFAFLKKELGLPEEITAIESQEISPLPIIQPETKITSPNDDRNPKQVTHELSLHLPKTTGNVMLLVTSTNSAETFFYTLKTPTEKAGHHLYVQNMSGGMGKIYKMAEKTDGQNVFVGNQFFFNYLLSEGVQFNMLAIHRIPFSRPNSPTQMARAKKYEKAYDQFSVPQAAINFQSIISDFLGNNWHGKQVLILDPRISKFEKSFF
jgi:DNA polymerase III epsilon subunit-like protein